MLLSLENGVWAPNLHFHNPNPEIPALQDGRLQVVDKPRPVRGGNVALNSFGFGGSNVHVILQPNRRPPAAPAPHAALPRLLLASGRTPEAAQALLEQGQQHSQNLAFVSMLNDLAVTAPSAMPFRGYAVLGGGDGSREVQQVPVGQRPVWFICSGESRPWWSRGAGEGGPLAAPLNTRCWHRDGLAVAGHGPQPDAPGLLPGLHPPRRQGLKALRRAGVGAAAEHRGGHLR